MNKGGSEVETNDSPGTFGLWGLVALVVANMVGTGVYTSSGYSMAALGDPYRVMNVWIVCGVWAVAGAIAYGSLARRLPISGGEYLFLSRLVHPSVGFMAGWISMVAGFTVSIALAAKASIAYAAPSLAASVMGNALAAGLVFLITGVIASGLRFGTGTQTAIVAIKLLLLSAFVAYALLFGDFHQADPSETLQPVADVQEASLSAWIAFVGSMSWIALSYTGFNAAVYVSGAVRGASRLVPLAMIVATIVVTVFYLLLNAVFVFAPQPEQITGKLEVAAIAAQAVGGDWLAGLMRLIVIVSTVSSVFSMLIAGPRVYQQMAIDGVMPRLFSDDGKAPVAALFLQAGISILVIFADQLLGLMQYLGVTLAACGGLAVLSLLWAGRKIDDAPRLAWWEALSAVVYLTITAAIIVGTYLEDLQRPKFFAMLGTFAAGAVVYAFCRRSGWLEFDEPTSPKNRSG
ncbi:MAG TPA: APC family permease [Planctomycetaceae bacterium]|nr:APC family permease [Planctomycetaceae bacterium]